MSITEYLDRMNILNNTLFRITPEGKGHFIYEGKEYTREQLRQMFPVPLSFVAYNKKNADGSRNYLYTE